MDAIGDGEITEEHHLCVRISSHRRLCAARTCRMQVEVTAKSAKSRKEPWGGRRRDVFYYGNRDRMIILEPICGLSNRMRALNSAILLSERIKRTLIVVWIKNKALNCGFKDLFVSPVSFRLVEYKRSNIVKQFVKKIFILGIVSLGKLVQRVNKSSAIMISDEEVRRMLEANKSFSCLGGFKTVYIQTCRSFFPSDSYERFVPTPRIQEEINQIKELFNEATIGIHIRRGGHEPASRISKTEKFVDSMNKEVLRDPKTLFFLATDSPNEEKYIKDVFRGRVLTRTKVFDPDSERGVKDALVDLYCLAGTRKILGSHGSSFSELSALIGQVPLEIIGEDNILEGSQ